MIKKFFRDNSVHKTIVPFFDIFFLFRPIGFLVVWVMICIGMYLSTFFPSSFYQETELYNTNFDFKTFLLFFGMSLLSSSICIINQISDKKSDEINEKIFVMNKIFSVEFARNTKNILLIVSLLILLFSGLKIFLLGVLLYIISGYLYNETPYEFKKKPFASLLCNFSLGLILLCIGFIHSMAINDKNILNIESFRIFLLITPYLLSFIAVSILCDVLDIKGDIKDNRNSIVIKFGKRKTAFLSTILVFLALCIAIKIEDPLSATSIIVSLPFFLYAYFRGLDKDIIRAIRYPIATLNLFTMTIYPYLFIAIFFIFYLSKYYYWHRFKIHYPTLLVDNYD